MKLPVRKSDRRELGVDDILDVKELVRRVTDAQPPKQSTTYLEGTNLIMEFDTEKEAVTYWNALNYYLAAGANKRKSTVGLPIAEGDMHVH